MLVVQALPDCNPLHNAMFTTFNSLVRAIQEVQVDPANNSDNEVRIPCKERMITAPTRLYGAG